MKRLLLVLLSLTLSVAAGPPSLVPVNGDRFMFVGASATSNHRWPAYIAAYYALRYPQFTLHFAMDARGGTNIKRMFAHDEFGWDTESPVSDYHVHDRTVVPYGADFVFIQHAVSGGYAASVDADHRQQYIEDYCEPDGMVPVIINGWMYAAAYPTGVAAEGEEVEIDARAVANDWNSSTIYATTKAAWGSQFNYVADATTDVITCVGHPFSDGMRVRLSDKWGANPAPLTDSPSDYFVRDISGDTFKLAATKGGSPIDLTTNGSGTSQISRKWALINGHNKEHFGAPGYMVLAMYMMDSLGMPTDVSSVTINAGTLTKTSSSHCTISSISANGHGGIDFDRLDDRLPYVWDDDWWADAVDLEPALLTHQDYSMTIAGLATGTYDIYANDVLIGSATAAELAAGWNMAALQAGPVFDMGKEVLGRIRDAQGRVRADHGLDSTLPNASPLSGFEKFKSVAATSYDVTGNRGAAHLAALSTQLANLNALDNLIHDAAQPEVLSFSVRSAIQNPDTPPTPPPAPTPPRGLKIRETQAAAPRQR